MAQCGLCAAQWVRWLAPSGVALGRAALDCAVAPPCFDRFRSHVVARAPLSLGCVGGVVNQYHRRATRVRRPPDRHGASPSGLGVAKCSC